MSSEVVIPPYEVVFVTDTLGSDSICVIGPLPEIRAERLCDPPKPKSPCDMSLRELAESVGIDLTQPPPSMHSLADNAFRAAMLRLNAAPNEDGIDDVEFEQDDVEGPL